jgi:hypothetical protein
MTSQSILFQSVLDPTTKIPVQQISNLQLNGISTIDALSNTDSGKLFGTFAYADPTYTLSLYKDSSRSVLVASATATGTGLATISQANSSGLSGSVNIIGFTAADNAIEALACLSMDSDLPMDNLTTLSDYDPSKGFASFHLQAYEYVKNVITSRFESVLFNPNLIDSRQINGGVGGFDLSRILNWQSPDLREAAALYAFYLLARKQGISADSIFLKRAETAYNKVKALLTSIEMQFDMQNTRIASKTRAMSTFKIGRA